MTPRRRALVVCGSALMAGGEFDMVRLLQHLSPTGWECEVALVVPEPGDVATALQGIGIQPHVFTVGRLRELGADVRAVHGLVRLARDVDVIHASDIRAALYSQAASVVARRPWTFHARDLYTGTPTFERALRRVRPKRVAAMSEAIARSGAATMKWRPDRVDVVYSGLDAAVFGATADRDSWRAEAGLGADEIAIGIVGRLVGWKGQDDFIRAAAVVAPSHSMAHFFVIGGELTEGASRWGLGEEASRLRRLAGSLGVADRITFTGPCSDVASAMAGLDVSVVASWAEPFGLVVLEAMSQGTAVVATDAGGVPEIVVDGLSGVLVPPRSPERIASALDLLLSDPERRRAIGTGGRSRLESIFRPEQGAESLAASWLRTIGRSAVA